LAAKNGNLQLMLMVLLHGGNLHFSTLQGDTPLHFAAASGNESLVELLIQKGMRVVQKRRK
jgi:ankyrin repeat protein